MYQRNLVKISIINKKNTIFLYLITTNFSTSNKIMYIENIINRINNANKSRSGFYFELLIQNLLKLHFSKQGKNFITDFQIGKIRLDGYIETGIDIYDGPIGFEIKYVHQMNCTMMNSMLKRFTELLHTSPIKYIIIICLSPSIGVRYKEITNKSPKIIFWDNKKIDELIEENADAIESIVNSLFKLDIENEIRKSSDDWKKSRLDILNEIKKAYKKGNSRAGCLFCPMGGGKGDYIQRKSYPEEIQVYIDMIKEMNARNKGDEVGLTTYITNGGWNARKNGRDLTINEKHYDESVKGGKLILTVTNPKTDWLEWIKTLGEIPFEYNYEETKDGYRIIAPAYILKKYPKVAKKFKQVFKKSAYCVGCRVCESNCPNGCISFENGLKIVNCIHCGQCHEIDDGCLAYHSLRTSLGGNGKMNNASINSFANHAPKLEWVREFFDMGNEYWELNSLGPNQVPMFKRFLRDTGLIDKNNKTTKLFDVIVSIGWESGTAWGLIASNFAYNPQFNWYINNLDVGTFYQRDTVSDLLINDGVKRNDATSIINAFKRFCELPLGTVLNWGAVYENGRQIDSLYRNKCAIVDNRVILYSLLLFVENCDENKEFTLSWLMDELVDRNGVSPSKVFGLDYEEMKSALMGLSQKYPDFIIASFTNDLDKISILQKKSEDVISLFEEEM